MVRDREIRIWMLRKGLKNCDVARGAGVHPSYVSHFLRNQKTNSPAIRTWLLEHDLEQLIDSRGWGQLWSRESS